MKNFTLMICLVFFGLFISCVSTSEVETSRRPLQQGEQVIGSVQATFISVRPANQAGVLLANENAYIALLEAARMEYQGHIDIRDIRWRYTGGSVAINGEFIGTGNVVSISGGRVYTTGIEGALARAAEEVSEAFTARSRLAIVYISAEDRSTTDFITGELEHILRRSGFVIIDRSELDRIRAEQRFGTSGEVDDSTAARIGHIAGASVVITGRVDGEGNLRRLRLRALDTSNGQVVGTASERL